MADNQNNVSTTGQGSDPGHLVQYQALEREISQWEQQRLTGGREKKRQAHAEISVLRQKQEKLSRKLSQKDLH